MYSILQIIFILTSCIAIIHTDNPCAPRDVSGQSIVCVCNSTYCDDVTREPPTDDYYVTYTSSKDGYRFKKSIEEMQKIHKRKCIFCGKIELEIDPSIRHQKVEGFGGAVTDAAGINWKSLKPSLQDYMIQSYYSERGLEYNMARVPIGGTDFSTRVYAYNEYPINDEKLTNFTLAQEDFQYKIPMIKAIQSTSKVPLHIVSSSWSPPPWMKTNNAFTGFSRLKKEHYQTYADYHLKFLQAYEAEGIPIWALTTTNEPINGVFHLAGFNTLGWTVSELGYWIVNNLGPTIRNSKYKDVKILTCDDQRATVPFFFNMLIHEHPKALDVIDGIGVHYYTDKLIPASILNFVTKNHPDKMILATEACEGSLPWQTKKVDLGSWDRAESYMKDIIDDFSYGVSGWIDWNLCLDPTGGPNWEKNFVDSPIIVDAERQEFYKQPMYYALGHIAKFVPRDSFRIHVSEKKPLLSSSVQHLAFLTPRNTIVLILLNSGSEKTIIVKCAGDSMEIHIPAKSIMTVEFKDKGNRHT